MEAKLKRLRGFYSGFGGQVLPKWPATDVQLQFLTNKESTA
jgi:hypothetical protein